MGLRGEARATMAQGRQAIAQSRQTLDKADHQLDTLEDLLEIGKAILQRIDRITEALEKNGIDINPKVKDTVLPVGANISTDQGASK